MRTSAPSRPRLHRPVTAPGSLYVRPTREDAERSPEHFFEIVRDLRSKKQLPLKVFANYIGDTSRNPAVTAHRKIENGSITDGELSRALYCLYEEFGRQRAALKQIPAAFYLSFLNFAMVRETSQDEARARSTGTYKFWRPSVHFEDEYVLAKIDFSEDPKTGALEACMLQVRQPSPGFGYADEHFVGNLFRISHLYLMILRDLTTNDIRITLITNRTESEVGTDLNPRSPFKGRMSHNVNMEGYVFGVDGQKRFFAPLYLSLVDDVDELAELDSKLNIVKENEVPERVLKKLKAMGKLQLL